MSDDLIELQRQGNRLLASRDYEGAKRTFQDLIRKRPDSSEGYVGLTKTLERLDDYLAIIELLEPVVSIVQSVRLKRMLGDAYRVLVNRGEPQYVDQAIKYYEAYHQEREDPVTLYDLGELYLNHKGDCSRALSCYQKSWEQDPRSRPAYLAVITCLKQLNRPQDIEKARTLWKERNTPSDE